MILNRERASITDILKVFTLGYFEISVPGSFESYGLGVGVSSWQANISFMGGPASRKVETRNSFESEIAVDNNIPHST